MRGPRHDLRTLAELSSLQGERLRAGFRVALANLARASSELTTPLEGLEPQALLRSVQRVEQAGLLHDLGWMSTPSSAAAVYQITAALPRSPQRTRLQGLLNRQLVHADAATFVALATALAQSSQSSFETARMQARVSLCLSLPIGTHTRVEGLALALISRPDLARAWLEEPSQGALPGRRLAARLLELAARAAAQRQARGDESGLQVLETSLVQTAWKRLLDDRESLVWKHVAAARGLLSEAVPRLADEIDKSLDPVLSPTEWRRGAASLAARVGVAPLAAAEAARRLLTGPVAAQDAGIGAAMLLGLPRAAEAEPDAVEPLLIPLLRLGGVYAIEAFLELLAEDIGPDFAQDARQFARRGLSTALDKPAHDDTQRALLEGLMERLDSAGGERAEGQLRAALHAFGERGIRAASPLALAALEAVRESVAQALESDPSTAEGRRTALRSLMDVETNVLQSSALTDLLSLAKDDGKGQLELEQAQDELGLWLSSLPVLTGPDGQLLAPTLQMRAVRAQLHLVDTGGSETRRDENRARRMQAVRSLFKDVAAGGPALLRRALIASAARGSEALVRDRTFELSDVALASMTYLREPHEMQALAEAAMMSDMEACLFAVAELTRRSEGAADNASGRRETLAALGALVHALPAGHSPRTTALRKTLLRVLLTLQLLSDKQSLSELVSDDATTSLDDLVHALQALAQLVVGARLRIDPESEPQIPSLGHTAQRLCDAIGTAVQERDPGLLREPLDSLCAHASQELPPPLALAVCRPLGVLPTLPLTARKGGSIARLPRVSRSSEVGAPEAQLPEWLPPSRTLGSFYVLHALGEGGGGSVFVVRRSEQRKDPAAELLALKVPEYDGDAARALSESDFLQMFREEAGALLAMPQDHPNLARLVTFDAGVKPKPILVMEYVEGPSLERLLARRHLDTAGAFDALIGIGRGLSAMHARGIGHLDVKPSNVILRDFWSGAGLEPVLVDFGMSGRRVRPGCCTAPYGAPEIWNEVEGSDPRPADVYAFGCVAYELLTGKPLFAAASDVALISGHMLHDGTPEPVAQLYENLNLRPLAELLTGCLRKQPSKRFAIDAVLNQLVALKPGFERQRWPLRAARKKRAQHV